MDRILISGGRIVDPASGRDAPGEVAVAAGRIVGLGAVPADFRPDRRIDATGIAEDGTLSLRARDPPRLAHGGGTGGGAARRR